MVNLIASLKYLITPKTLNISTQQPDTAVVLKKEVCTICRVATVREKYLENEIFFHIRGKLGNFVDGQGNLERTWKVREKSGNLKINGYGRQTSENLFIMFERGKDVLSHEPKPISPLIGGYS